MKRRAFLEKIEKEWMDDFVYISRQPLVDLGFEIVPFEGTNVKNISRFDPTKNDMIVGSVEATIEFFKLIDVTPPNYLGYPKSLQKYLGRTIHTAEFQHLKVFEFPYFIKPVFGVKRFTGCVIEKPSFLKSLKDYDNVDDTDLVYVSSMLDIQSEYRCFVHKGILKGMQYYSGDFRLHPNSTIVESMIKDYQESKEANVSYTLDVAVLKDGSTVLIEVNDFWAIGSYGFDGKTYARMAIDRFYEIIKQD